VPTLKLRAPLSGWCAALEEVPDAVFSGSMLGDGLAIDPTSASVRAPCAGEVTTVPAAGHAVTIRSSEGGVDVLVHVGIDTVQLRGLGFTPCVRVGQMVAAGEELLRLDLDMLARTAKSLLTPIVVTPADGVQIVARHEQGPIRQGDVLIEVAYPPGKAVRESEAGGVSRTVRVALEHGLHARPAALLMQRQRSFASDVTLSFKDKRASVRSVIALMALGVRKGDELTVTASGADAAAALDAVTAALDEALQLERASAAAPPAASSSLRAVPPEALSGGARALAGVIAVRGFAVGRAARLARTAITVTEAGRGTLHESAEFDRARASVRARLLKLAEVGGETRRDIVAAHVAFLDDPLLNEATQEKIAAGKSAGFAWRAAVRRSIAALEALADPRQRERADDLMDIESHVLLALSGEARPMKIALPEDAVLIADELLPSELVALDRSHLAAICLEGGGPTSHVAILAAAMDVPMLVGLGSAIGHLPAGTPLIVDAHEARLYVDPDAPALSRAEARARAERAQRGAERSEAQREAHSADGTRVEVFANLGSVADAEAAVAVGAEGCGLLRTEFLFIERDSPPAEAEQLEVYQQVAAALGSRPLVLRLMDVGGDKPLKYLPLPKEDNPALGLRGIRTGLWRADLLRTQLRAALRVTPVGRVRLLLPMVSELSEIQTVRRILTELMGELRIPAPIELGAMIETPAAALTAEHLLTQADFISIGSNDLTQYTLAMDRGHPELARRIDALHPAVLRLIAAATGAAVRAGKLAAVCGGVAADPAAVPLLIGFGARELSVVPAAIPALKRQIGGLTVRDCEALAVSCLSLGSAAEVRTRVAQAMAGSGGSR
jgi:phosphocarrier protein FPr/phosphocarrier protein